MVGVAPGNSAFHCVFDRIVVASSVLGVLAQISKVA